MESLKDEVLTVKDLVEIFDVSEKAVYEWVKNGDLIAHKIKSSPKGKLFFKRVEVLAALKRTRENPRGKL